MDEKQVKDNEFDQEYCKPHNKIENAWESKKDFLFPSGIIHQKFILRLTLILAIPFFTFNLIQDFFEQKYLISFLLILILFILFISSIFLSRSKYHLEQPLFKYLTISFFVLSGILLVYMTGFRADTSRMPWVLIFPMIAFPSLGLKKGLLFCIALLISILFFNINFSHPMSLLTKELEIRFFIALAIIIAASFFSEKMRADYQKVVKKSYLAVQKSERKYHTLVEVMNEGLVEVDENWRMTFVNDRFTEMMGFSRDQLIGRGFHDLSSEKHRDKALKEHNRRRQGKYGTYELELVRANGEKIVTLCSPNPFYDSQGNYTGGVGVVSNITKLKLAEQEKIKAQKITGEQQKLALIGQVAGKMAHDFNNIMGIIMGNAELSLMDCKDAEIKKTLELIFEQTIRGKNLTKNLVAFAKSQEPKQKFFKINETVDLVISLLKQDIEGIELIREDKASVPDLLADPGMIKHVLVNLVQNSIHAISKVEHPRIKLKTYSLDGNICFEIKDNGCGIPDKSLGNIYEPSFTLKGSRDVTGSYKTGIKGTGYGMSNVKKYIDQHKGNISVESEFGSGTKVTISLPIVKTELTSEEKAEIRKEKVHFNKYILIVEDELSISGVQYKILSQEPCNHKVDIANDGQVAMDLLDRNQYDFISLDYILPGKINGMDVYDHIRKTNKTIPILFISGNIEFLESIKDLKHKDANIDHLSKPCRNKDYVNSINELLESACGTQG